MLRLFVYFVFFSGYSGVVVFYISVYILVYFCDVLSCFYEIYVFINIADLF